MQRNSRYVQHEINLSVGHCEDLIAKVTDAFPLIMCFRHQKMHINLLENISRFLVDGININLLVISDNVYMLRVIYSQRSMRKPKTFRALHHIFY